MDQINWNMVAACANVVIATTAVVAAWYALRQYRYAVRSQEMAQILEIYKTHSSFSNKAASDAPSEPIIEDILLHFEMQERAIDAKMLSRTAMAFYQDIFDINDLSRANDEALNMVRSILERDKKTYKTVIERLKGSEKTKHIINW